MASKRRLRRRACESKVSHPDQAAAVAHALALLRTKGERVQTYRCPWCGGWHVGRPDKRKRQAMRAKRGGR